MADGRSVVSTLPLTCHYAPLHPDKSSGIDDTPRKDPVLVAPRPTRGSGYARFPRPRRKPLPSSLTNVVSLLPPSPVKEDHRRAASTSMDTIIIAPSMASTESEEDNGSAVEVQQSQRLHITNCTEDDCLSDHTTSSAEHSPRPRSPTATTGLGEGNRASIQARAENGLANPWATTFDDSASVQELEVLSILDSMSQIVDAEKMSRISSTTLERPRHLRGQSEPALNCSTGGAYLATQSRSGSEVASSSPLSGSSSSHRLQRTHQIEEQPRTSSPSYFVRTPLSHALESPGTSASPFQDHGMRRTPSAMSRSSIATSSPGLSSTPGSLTWETSAKTAFPPTPLDLVSPSSVYTPHMSSVASSRSERKSNVASQLEAFGNLRPHRARTDHESASSACSDARNDGSLDVTSVTDASLPGTVRTGGSTELSGTLKARELIKMFEQGLGLGRASPSLRARSNNDDPSTRASSSCYSSTVRPRLLRPCDLLGIGSAVSIATDDPTVIRPKSSIPSVDQSTHQRQPMASGLVAVASHEDEDCTLRAASEAATRLDHNDGEIEQMQSKVHARRASLPLTDLVPHTLSSESLATGLRETQSVQQERSPTEGTTASFRHQREEGRRSTSPERAISMVQPTSGPPLQAGQVWYYDVHTEQDNPRWVSAQAILFEGALALSWLPRSGGRENVVLELEHCHSVHSLPSEQAIVLEAERENPTQRQLKPFQFVFPDGVERVGVDSIRERAQWVARARNALANSLGGSADIRSTSTRPQSPTMPVQSLQHAAGRPVLDPQLERISGLWRSNDDSTQTQRSSQTRRPSEAPTLPPKDFNMSEMGTRTVEARVGQLGRSDVEAGAVASVRPSISAAPASARSPSSQKSFRLSAPPRSTVGTYDDRSPRLSVGLDADDLVTALTASPVSLAMLSLPDFDEIYPGDSASQCIPASDAGTRIELPDHLRTLHRPRSGSPLRPRGDLPGSKTKSHSEMRETSRDDFMTAQVQPMLDVGSKRSTVPRTASPSARSAKESTFNAGDSTRTRAVPTGMVRALSPSSAQRHTVASRSDRFRDSPSEVSKVLSYLEKPPRAGDVQSAASGQNPSSAAAQSLMSRLAPSLASAAASEAHLIELKSKVDRLTAMVQQVSQQATASNKSAVSCAAISKIDKDIQSLLQKIEARRNISNEGDELAGRSTVTRDVTDRWEKAPSALSWTQRSVDVHNAGQDVVGSHISDARLRQEQTEPAPSEYVPPVPTYASAQSEILRSPVGGFHTPTRGSVAGFRSEIPRGSPMGPRSGHVSRSQVTVDMEAAVRERRAQRAMPTASSRRNSPVRSHQPGPGWTSPSPRGRSPVQQGQQFIRQGSPARSVLAHMPMPRAMPVPEQAATGHPFVPASNLATSAVAEPSVLEATMAAAGMGAGLVAELARVIEDLKAHQTDRAKSEAQQVDMARRLDDLKTWAEQSAGGRTEDLKGLQDGIEHLKSEIAHLRAAPPAGTFRSTYPLTGQELPPGANAMPVPQVERDIPFHTMPVPDLPAKQATAVSDAPSTEMGRADAPVATDPEVIRSKSKLDHPLRWIREEVRRHHAALARIGRSPETHDGDRKVSEELFAKLEEAMHSGDRKQWKQTAKDVLLLVGGATLEKLAEEIHKKSQEEPRLPSEPVAEPEPPEDSSDIAEESGSDQLPPPQRMNDHGGNASSQSSTAGPTPAGHAETQAALAAYTTATTSLLEQILAHVQSQQAQTEELRKEVAALEASRLEAEGKWREESTSFSERQATAIIGAVAQHVSNERRAREEKEAEQAKVLDPKSAIETLVKALNDTRLEEAAKREQTNRAVAELAAGVERSTERQHERLLTALTALSRDVVCTSVDNHLQHFKGAMANSFAGSAQAMADAWTAHAQHVASMPRATLGAPPQGHIVVIHQQPPPPPAAAPAKKEEKPKEEKPKETPAPAPAPPQPPPPRPLGPYGVAPRWGC